MDIPKNVIGMNERIVWETTKVCLEYEGVNLTTVKFLDRDYKYIYTFVKKHNPVKATVIFEKFPKMEVESILYDLREMHLVYFVREVK